jgi:hypothetical protein
VQTIGATATMITMAAFAITAADRP